MKAKIKHFLDWFTYDENGDFYDRRNLVPPCFWVTLLLVGIAFIVVGLK